MLLRPGFVVNISLLFYAESKRVLPSPNPICLTEFNVSRSSFLLFMIPTPSLYILSQLPVGSHSKVSNIQCRYLTQSSLRVLFWCIFILSNNTTMQDLTWQFGKMTNVMLTPHVQIVLTVCSNILSIAGSISFNRRWPKKAGGGGHCIFLGAPKPPFIVSVARWYDHTERAWRWPHSTNHESTPLKPLEPKQIHAESRTESKSIQIKCTPKPKSWHAINAAPKPQYHKFYRHTQ